MSAPTNENTQTWKSNSENHSESTESCGGTEHNRDTVMNSNDLLHVNGTKSSSLIIKKTEKKSKPDGPLMTFRPPPSSILSQVKEFLPKMEKANKDLQRKLQHIPASELDIETVTETEDCVIEMNVAVVEQGEDDSASEDSDSSVDLSPEVNEDNFKIRKKTNKLKPNIEEISSNELLQGQVIQDKT